MEKRMSKPTPKEFAKFIATATEKELRECEVPWPKTDAELAVIITALSDRSHDYGTCVYAMSFAALAAFYLMAHKLGVTGFQASCADMDFIGRTRHMKHGFRIINYENLLYPQYCNSKHFPSYHDLLDDEDVKKQLRDQAIKKLSEETSAHPNVRAHWEFLASLCERVSE
jgi:hypothetical protein